MGIPPPSARLPEEKSLLLPAMFCGNWSGKLFILLTIREEFKSSKETGSTNETELNSWVDTCAVSAFSSNEAPLSVSRGRFVLLCVCVLAGPVTY